ncbi:MAG: branched-chain amino acid ABC transporter permease, partial [Mesorhizobium sp.]
MPRKPCSPVCANASPARPDAMDFVVTTLLNGLTLIS